MVWIGRASAIRLHRHCNTAHKFCFSCASCHNTSKIYNINENQVRLAVWMRDDKLLLLLNRKKYFIFHFKPVPFAADNSYECSRYVVFTLDITVQSLYRTFLRPHAHLMTKSGLQVNCDSIDFCFVSLARIENAKIKVVHFSQKKKHIIDWFVKLIYDNSINSVCKDHGIGFVLFAVVFFLCFILFDCFVNYLRLLANQMQCIWKKTTIIVTFRKHIRSNKNKTFIIYIFVIDLSPVHKQSRIVKSNVHSVVKWNWIITQFWMWYRHNCGRNDSLSCALYIY